MDLPRVLFAALYLLFVAALLPDSAAEPAKKFSHGLLWRVSKPGVPPSYVFGTIHVADPRILELPEPVNRALARSRRYYMESFQGEREAARLFEAAQFEDGRRLEPLIGAEAYGKVAAMLRERRVPEETIARIKPWAALANVTVTPEDYERTTLDQKLVGLARARKLRVLGLEGIEEQISVFDRIPVETQIGLLKHALDHRDELAAMIEPTVQAWIKRDLAGIHAASERVAMRYPEVAEHYRVLHRLVVENRSIVMAHRLFMPLREGRAFIAVGADHLYGEQGMLALIEQQGYRVARMY
ncbi:MAG TPA: TraB/GumN family protein [Burkholderiales bacterium]|nr:TraB/GumN family protein [Burkholderiales bacterium]